MNEPLLVLSGEGVALGPLRTDLAELFARWRTDLDVRQGMDHPRIESTEHVAGWLDERTREAAERRATLAAFTVYDLADLAPVGWTALFEIDHRHGTATFGITIGERRGQGLGREAARLTLDWAFFVLGLRNVMLETSAWNVAALRSYRAAGFREIGRRRDAIREWGRRWDLVIMDAVPEDFESPVLAARRPDPRS